MVFFDIRNRINKEAVNEDLRANRKVFEREQQQIALFPKSELPPNNKVQAIAYQFNKDIENVKNALNDGLTEMNSPENIQRGFADFSKVSLAWNKLVARINPYLKGQQLSADIQPPTAGDYAFVKRTLYEALGAFFTNAIQQVNNWKQTLEANGVEPVAQNERVIRDILNQVETGFYSNVAYGRERRSRIAPARLPEEPQAGQVGNLQPMPPFNPDPAVLAAQQAAAAAPLQRPAQGNLTDADIAAFEEYEFNNQEIDANDDPAQIAQDVEAIMFNNADPNNLPTDQERADMRARLEGLVPEYIQLRDGGGAEAAPVAPAAAAAQPAAAAAPQDQPQAPQDQPQQAVAPRRGANAAQFNRQLIQQVIDDEFGGMFDGYADMPEGQRRQLSGEVRNLAERTGLGYRRVQNYLMTGNGMTGAGDLTTAAMKGFGVGARGQPLRIANSFTGNSTKPNTLADLKNRYKGKEYIGDSNGSIIRNLQNRGVLGSGKTGGASCCADCAAGRSCGGRRCCFNTTAYCNGSKHYRFKASGGGFFDGDIVDKVFKGVDTFNYKNRVSSGNATKDDIDRLIKEHNKKYAHLKGQGRTMTGGSNAEVEVNVKYSKLPKALQPTEEDLEPKPKRVASSGGQRRRRLPKESYEGYDGEDNDAYAVYGKMNGLGKQEDSEMLHSEMLQDKALGLLKGLPRRYGVEDPKYSKKK